MIAQVQKLLEARNFIFTLIVISAINSCTSKSEALEAQKDLQEKLNESTKHFEKDDSIYPILNLDSLAYDSKSGDSFPLQQMIQSYDSAFVKKIRE
jgi:hypothetical protein